LNLWNWHSKLIDLELFQTLNLFSTIKKNEKYDNLLLSLTKLAHMSYASSTYCSLLCNFLSLIWRCYLSDARRGTRPEATEPLLHTDEGVASRWHVVDVWLPHLPPPDRSPPFLLCNLWLTGSISGLTVVLCNCYQSPDWIHFAALLQHLVFPYTAAGRLPIRVADHLPYPVRQPTPIRAAGRFQAMPPAALTRRRRSPSSRSRPRRRPSPGCTTSSLQAAPSVTTSLQPTLTSGSTCQWGYTVIPVGIPTFPVRQTGQRLKIDRDL
jgi:hypothetical protein